MPIKYLQRKTEDQFPNLRRADYFVSSDADGNYNCFAYVVNEQSAHWYPTKEDEEGVYWPPGIAREETLEAFIEAYKTKGYFPCDDINIDLEAGYEKIAIYINPNDVPGHAARQLASGAWTSKLGLLEDIEHKTLSSLESNDPKKPAYWKIAKILKRKIDMPVETRP